MNSSNTTTAEQETENNKTETEHKNEEKLTLFMNKRNPDVILEQSKRKKNNIKLIPPKETDQPKPSKRKYTKPKLKIENGQKQNKLGQRQSQTLYSSAF